MLYEYVFEHNYTLYARIFNPLTKQSYIKEYKSYEHVPELYIPSKEPTEYTSFYDGTPLKKKTFKNTYELYQYQKNLGFNKSHLFGSTSRVQKCIRDEFGHQNNNHDMRTHYIDIETRAVHGFAKPDNPIEEVSLIQVYDNFLGKYVIFGTKSCELTYKSEFGEVIYKQCKDERELLEKYLLFIEKTNPTILVGFNSEFFDIRYLVNRMEYIGMNSARLSPINAITKKNQKSNDGIEYLGIDIKGRIQLDLRDLYIKYTTQKPERFSLDIISKLEEIGEKVEYDGTIEEFYNNDFNKFVEYGIRDVELLIKLEKKLKLIKVCSLIAYTCGVNADEVSGTLQQWEALMRNTAIAENIVIPLQQVNIVSDSVSYPGGWVRVHPGLHENVCSYDFTSLYPNIIIAFLIGLDNYIPTYNIPISKAQKLENNRAEYFNEKPRKVIEYIPFEDNIPEGCITNKLPQDIQDLLDKYFNLYNENYDKSDNDNLPEFLYFKNLIQNRDEIIKVCQKYKIAITPNGCIYFTNGRSIFAELILNFFKSRIATKDKMVDETDPNVFDELDLLQYMYKILMNAAYGSTALAINPFSFGKKMSESITTTGRYLNMWVAYRVNEYCNKKYNLNLDVDKRPLSIQCDTDSNYFEFNFINTPNDIIENQKILKEFCKNEIDKVIEEAIEEAIYTLTGNHNKNIAMEQETIADKLLSCARKRYVGRYYDKKKNKIGYKITGLSLIDKTTPTWTKKKLKDCLDLILDKNFSKLTEFIEQAKKEYKLQPLNTILTNKTVNNLNYIKVGEKWKCPQTGNACPLQSRGSILYNKLVDNYPDLPKIREGEKIFVLYLKTPNPITNENIICIPDEKILHYQKNVEQFVDFDTLFEKNFLQKLNLMVDVIGYDYKERFSGELDLWS